MIVYDVFDFGILLFDSIMDKNSVKRHVRFKEGNKLVYWFFLFFFGENIVID